MAKKGKKLTGKALAAARKNIKKAQAAIKRKTGGSKPKSRSQSKKGSKRSGSSTMAKKKSGGRKGTSLKTRAIKFGAGAGIAVVVSLIANALRRNEVNAAAPILDAAAGLGIEGQVGTAIVRTVAPLVRNGGFRLGNGNGSQMLALEGA